MTTKTATTQAGTWPRIQPGSVTIGNSAQTVQYTELLRFVDRIGEHRLRLIIHSNAYRDQSYATIERWANTLEKWQTVYNLRGGEMKWESGLYVRREFETAYRGDREHVPPPMAQPFDQDRMFLIERAVEVLGTE